MHCRAISRNILARVFPHWLVDSKLVKSPLETSGSVGRAFHVPPAPTLPAATTTTTTTTTTTLLTTLHPCTTSPARRPLLPTRHARSRCPLRHTLSHCPPPSPPPTPLYPPPATSSPNSEKCQQNPSNSLSDDPDSVFSKFNSIYRCDRYAGFGVSILLLAYLARKPAFFYIIVN